MRDVVKSAAELLLSMGPSAISRRRHRARALVLAYHNIVPRGESAGGDGSLHLGQDRFAGQLDLLQRHCEVVPLQELVDEPTGRSDRPRVAITFDDAYQGAVVTGVEELRKRGLPATIFVAPGLLDGRSFWWDDLVPEGAPALPDDIRAPALADHRGSDLEIRDWARQQGMQERKGNRHATGAMLSELGDAMRYPGLTLAAHSWSHPNLVALTSDALESELERPLQWLREHFERVLPYLAYPYGFGGQREAERAERVGYVASFRVEGGWLPLSPSRWNLPRLNVPSGLSPRGFELRISGLLTPGNRT
jgi:peptidoglycan/xylan/chitin deacetylase (PgdA/CDA1 family)